MLRYMLDTNICIALLKGRAQKLQNRCNEDAPGLCISSITLYELQTGVEKSRMRVKSQALLHALLANLPVIEFDEAAAVHSGEIRGHLEKQGTPIGPCDTLIAGHARSAGLIIVTDNEKEFRRVDGLIVENWLRA